MWRLNERFQIFFEDHIDPFGGGDILYRQKLSAWAFYQSSDKISGQGGSKNKIVQLCPKYHSELFATQQF